MAKCLAEMPCGHSCPQMCHAMDRNHARFKCKEPCTRACPVGHPCPKECFKDCHPCLGKVAKTLPCSHEHVLACSEDPAEQFCPTMLWKVRHTIDPDRLLIHILVLNDRCLFGFRRYRFAATASTWRVGTILRKRYVLSRAEWFWTVSMCVNCRVTRGAVTKRSSAFKAVGDLARKIILVRKSVAILAANALYRSSSCCLVDTRLPYI